MAKHLSQKDFVRDIFIVEGRNVTPKLIQETLKTAGTPATYKNCFNAHKRLWTEFFGSDTEQYSFVPSYVSLLKERGHFADLVLDEDTFRKLVVIYREGVQAFKYYTACGLSVDGTFLKTTIQIALN